MDHLTFNLIFGVLLRSVIMMGAGWLVAHGMLPSGTVEEWVTAVVMVLITLLWSLYEKIAQKAKEKFRVEVALEAPAGTTMKELDAAIEGTK
jgi:hypothetical protein